MESSQNGNSGEFRLRCKRILLTYSQVGPDFDTQSAVRLFGRLGARGVLAREQHRDGGIHYHAFILFDTTHHTRNAAEFDVGGAHPNIKAIRWTPQRAYDYVRKDGDIIWNNLDESDLDGSQSTSGRHWADIISSPDKTSFYDAIKTLDPRALVCSFPSIEKYADWAYRVTPEPYHSPTSWSDGDFTEWPELEEWYEENVRGGDLLRGGR